MSDFGTCEVQRMKLTELVPAEYNPRKMSDKAMSGLQASIARFGILEPIVWNRRTGNIVGGHQRYRILAEKGEQEADVVVVELDESEEVALNIALNSKELRGQFTSEAVGMLREAEAKLGSEFAKLGLIDLHNAIKKKLKKTSEDATAAVMDHVDGEPPEADEPEAVIVCPKCTSRFRMKDNAVMLDATKVKP